MKTKTKSGFVHNGTSNDVDFFPVGDVDVIVVYFKERADFSNTLLRMSEYKECPVHAETIFTLDEYNKWFLMDSGFTYDDSIAGINLPSESFVSFYEAFKSEDEMYHPSEDEMSVMKWLEDIGYLKVNKHSIDVVKRFYLIGVNADLMIGDEEIELVIKHEMSHALYYVDENYREIVNSAWDALSDDQREDIKEYLISKNYTDDVMVDEFGAYAIEPFDSVLPRKSEMPNLMESIEGYYKSRIITG